MKNKIIFPVLLSVILYILIVKLSLSGLFPGYCHFCNFDCGACHGTPEFKVASNLFDRVQDCSQIPGNCDF